MIVTLSGFEGSGKSTIVNDLKKNNFLVIPETARLLIPLEKTVLNESKDDLSYKSFIAYLSGSHFIFENNLDKKSSIVFDRNIIDSLTYLEQYSNQKIDLDMLQDYILMFLEEKKRETLYDNVILINHSNNNLHIENNIMKDKLRLYSSSANSYKENAKIWEDIYLEKYNKLKYIGKRLVRVESYPDNAGVFDDIKNILNI